MKRISFLVLEDSFEAAIFPSIQLLETTNLLMQESGSEMVFDIRLIGYQKRHIQLSPYSTIHCDGTTRDEWVHDLIVVPGIRMDTLPTFDCSKYKSLIQWLKMEHTRGVELASMCTGALLLAKSGLLDEKTCTTHWQGCDIMRKQFPNVQVEASAVFTKNNGIYTSGGAFSSIQLTLHFIELACGKEIAIQMAKMLSVEYPIRSQNQFYTFQSQKTHNDESILLIQSYMEKHYASELKVDELSRRVNMSTRNFIRRFKSATGETPIQYLQKIRIEMAKKALEDGRMTVLGVMQDIGYSDIKSFSVLFKRLTGLTPAAYAKRYNVNKKVA